MTAPLTDARLQSFVFSHHVHEHVDPQFDKCPMDPCAAWRDFLAALAQCREERDNAVENCGNAVAAYERAAAALAAARETIAEVDAIVSRLHDTLYGNDFDLTGEHARAHANKLVWQIHDKLRALLAGEGTK